MRRRITSEKNSVVAVFESHNQAEDAVRELQKSGFDMTQLSIVGKDYHSEDRLEDHTQAAEATIHAEPAAVSA